MSKELDFIVRSAHISCMMDPRMKHMAGISDDKYLEPEYWEEMRLRLQATARFATGEHNIVVVLQDGNSNDLTTSRRVHAPSKADGS